MNNRIFEAHYTAPMDGYGHIIRYYGHGLIGKLELTERFFPCDAGRLKKLLRWFKDPLGEEYTAFCWSLYHELSDMKRYIGAAGKTAANKLLKDLDIIAAELDIH